MVRVPKGKKAEVQAAATAAGMSVNQFCALAIDEKLKSVKESDYDT